MISMILQKLQQHPKIALLLLIFFVIFGKAITASNTPLSTPLPVMVQQDMKVEGQSSAEVSTPMPTQSITEESSNLIEQVFNAPTTNIKTSGNSYSGGDKDCDDFATHVEAQAYFTSKGGSATNNVDRLDRDHDGVACETLP
jgi:hypothetical protein